MPQSDGFAYRDLNKNGRLDPYEDPRRPLEERVTDLLGQMTLEEKAGLMFHTILPVGQDGALVEEPTMFSPNPTSWFVREQLINHFNVHQLPAPRLAAEWHNRLQQMAEGTRLGIPVTVSSDPRHGFVQNVATSFMAAGFSQWPEPIGLAAIGEEETIREFGDIARREYLAVGIRVALHPMADLATEPRWARANGTFGEDAALSARLTAAYIRGFQGTALGAHSVACMTKHFPGGGPQKDGLDAHFDYGKEQIYPGGNFDYHLLPFEAAFQAGTAQIMPYYGQPIGVEGLEEVGFGFNKQVITGLLREKYGFEGVVCTDWRLITPAMRDGKEFMNARCWGVEELSVDERLLKVLDAGVDQFGGEECPELIVALVRAGKLSEARLDQSARRILREKFRLGLFDHPFVDPALAESVVGQAAFLHAGELAQRKSLVLLKNSAPGGAPLPLQGKPRLYLEGLDPQAAAEYGQVVATPAQAELAILRLNTPFQPKPEMGFFANFFHEGDLDFKSPEKERILDILGKVPTIVVINMDRAAVIPEIAAGCAALLVSFGASDAAVLDVLSGRFSPVGKLPFELPSSMQAVRAQKEDLPCDSADPLFPFGFGLSY